MSRLERELEKIAVTLRQLFLNRAGGKAYGELKLVTQWQDGVLKEWRVLEETIVKPEANQSDHPPPNPPPPRGRK